MKLSLSSLPFVGLNNLCHILWSCSLLNLAAWLSSLKSLPSSSDWSPVIVSSFTVGVDSMAPVTMRVAWCCTLLTRSKLDLAVVSHAVMLYSSTGLILPVYSLLSHSICTPCRACQLLHDGKLQLDSDFSFFSLFPRQPLVESHPEVGGGCPQQAESGH